MKEEMKYINLLKKNLQNAAPFVPPHLHNEKVFSVIIVELRSLIIKGEKIRMNANIFETILNMYPNLLRAFDEKFVEETILNELKESTTTLKTMDDISKKYGIDIAQIKIILEKIKDTNIELYNEITEALQINKKQQRINMQEDIDNLEQIVSIVEPTNKTALTNEQKIIFAYLSGKYLHNSLEDICEYVITKKVNKPELKTLFNSVLKLTHLYISTTSQDKIDEITLNNSWHQDYSREKFFGIKNGVPTIDNKYGKKAELLTLNTEQVIVETLKTEEIPLKEVVVKGAFREFFKDNLFEYIYKLKGYDKEFEKTKKKAKI